jgi:hypothetical protein
MKVYRQELLNLNNPEEYRFALEIAFNSCKPPDPLLTWMYYKEFGPREKLEEAERDLHMISSLAKSLRKSLENAPEDVKEMRTDLPWWGMYICARRGEEKNGSEKL